MCNTCGNSYCGGCNGVFPFNRPFYNPPYTTPFNRQCLPNVPPVPAWPCPTCQPCTDNGCLVKIVTNCVLTSSALVCLNLGAGTSLTTVLNAIDLVLCTYKDNITIINQTLVTINETITTIQADIDAGHFTPTLTNEINITASSVATDALYSRVKNVVTVQYSIYVTPIATALTKLVVTLPAALPANPSGSSAGQGAYYDNGTVTAAEVIFVDSTHVSIWFTPVTSGNSYVLNFSVMYRKS